MRDTVDTSAGFAGDPHSEAIWRKIEQEFLSTGDARRAQAALGEAVDSMVVAAYRASIEPVLPHGVVLIGAGACGRGELFPYSAVELLVLIEGESSWVSLRDPLDEFVRALWDARLRLNHTVRPVAECLEYREQNIELSVSLLDARFLAGDEAAYARFTNKWAAFVERNGAKLSQHLAGMAKARHARYQNTFLHREPDVHESPGGLRDASVAGWLTRLAGTRSDSARLREAVTFLSTVRCFLHYRTTSDRNLLTSEAQEAIAAQPFEQAATAKEWMRRYFEHAGVVFAELRAALDTVEKSEPSLVGNLRDWRSKLSNSEFTVSRERVLLRNWAQPVEDPAVVFRLLEFTGRHGIAPAPETERRLGGAYAAFASYCAGTKRLWPMIESLLSLPHATLALRSLHNSGLMPALLPEWERIAGVIRREAEHRYAIDEHTIQAVERAAELRSSLDTARQRFVQLLSEIDAPAVLLFALLMHDIGEDRGGDNGVQRSAELAREVMARIAAPEEERGAIEFLIENQNLLAEAMSGRDMDDPATAVQLAAKVGTIERLRQLTVLTYGCIAAVSPDAMTAWRLEQLWRAYEVAQRELTRELETDRIQNVPSDAGAGAVFLTGFPTRYLRAHAPAEVEAHVRLYEESRPTGAAVQLDRIDGGYKLTIIARDRPALFASFAGALSSFGLDILKAEAFSNAKRVILDTFVFTDPQRTLDLNPSESERLLDLIRRVALGKTDGQRLLRGRGVPDPKKRAVQPQVNFDSDACETATLVEIVAEDRPGLLFNLATVFTATACNIDVVLIDTKGRRAIDVFYVAHSGQKLTPSLQAMLKDRLLEVC